jgi:hypothetical protein
MTAASQTISTVCNTLQCVWANIHRQFGAEYCFHLQNRNSNGFIDYSDPQFGGRKLLRNICDLSPIKGRLTPEEATRQHLNYSSYEWKQMVAVDYLTFPHRIWDVPCSNVGRETGIAVFLSPSTPLPVQPQIESRSNLSLFLIPRNFSRNVTNRWANKIVIFIIKKFHVTLLLFNPRFNWKYPAPNSLIKANLKLSPPTRWRLVGEV